MCSPSDLRSINKLPVIISTCFARRRSNFAEASSQQLKGRFVPSSCPWAIPGLSGPTANPSLANIVHPLHRWLFHLLASDSRHVREFHCLVHTDCQHGAVAAAYVQDRPCSKSASSGSEDLVASDSTRGLRTSGHDASPLHGCLLYIDWLHSGKFRLTSLNYPFCLRRRQTRGSTSRCHGGGEC